MEIKQILNSSEKEVISRKFNIFIAISLGNKWFIKENLREYLNLGLKFTKDKVLFLIGDKIQAINYNVRNNNKRSYNLKRALKNGDKIKEIIEEIVLELPKEKQDKVKLLNWEEYEEQDEFYKEYKPIVYREFEKNKKFQKEILSIVRNSIVDKRFTEEEYLELTNYVLEEFLLTYSGIKLDKEYYGAYFYPSLFPITLFIEHLQKGKIFSEINRKLPREKSVLVIVN